ncbi:MAG: hypothetical protein JXR76_27630 [Deltaproteobacteria bacterium]|nr:hypothetical protein [Deltaproteobacteria bacterium]
MKLSGRSFHLCLMYVGLFAALIVSAILLAACDDAMDESYEKEMALDADLDDSKVDLYVNKNKIWPSTIKVCWEQDGLEKEKGWIKAGLMYSWEAYSSVRFVDFKKCPFMGSPGYYGLRVGIDTSGAGQSYTLGLGNDLNNKSWGVVINSCPEYTTDTGRRLCMASAAAHEFGHALGFAHEQNRPESTCRPCIAGKCMPGETCRNGQCIQGPDGNVTIGTFDKESVMSYCASAHNANGVLSQTDILGATHYYGSAGRLTDSEVFNVDYYLNLYPSLKATFGSDKNRARRHWVVNGIREGKRAHPKIHSTYYLNRYPELAPNIGWGKNLDLNARALFHWMTYGRDEGRIGAP